MCAYICVYVCVSMCILCGVYVCVINKNNAQVFVFSRGVYSRIKERVKTRGVLDIPTSEMSNYFSPSFAEHVGTVKVWIEDLVLIAVFKNINLNFIRTYDKYFLGHEFVRKIFQNTI